MKVYQTNEIKNIALLGSSGSGKTIQLFCISEVILRTDFDAVLAIKKNNCCVGHI